MTHHIPWITLHVSDIKNSLAFYQDLLGMEVASAVDGPAAIRFLKTDSDLLLELIHIEGEPTKNAGKGISFALETKDIPTLISGLKEAHIPVSEPFSPNPMFRFHFIQDPDGYNIQLVERLTPCQHK